LRTVAVVALKGGSGKTTLATHLALAAHLRGLDTLVVDTDPQHSAQDVLGARSVEGPACIIATGPKLMEAQFDAASRRRDLLVIDTAAGAIENVTEAIVLADLIVMVARPTLMDLAGLARTFMLVRKLGKPSTVVLSQAPVARGGVESPLVSRVKYGLDYMKAPVAPVIVRSRTIYQTALERGRSAEEMTDKAAAREIAELWAFVADTVDLPAGAASRKPDANGARAQPTP
jgi:chromosome partitioning protein